MPRMTTPLRYTSPSALSRNPSILTILALWLFVTLFALPASAQLHVGNLTHVLPQCETVCTAFDVITTECNAVGVFEITYIYCECTDRNLQIIETCFDCQSVNATEQALYQELLNDVVNTCNDKNSAPDSTLSVSPLSIVPSFSASATTTSAAHPGPRSPLPLSSLCWAGTMSAALAAAGGLLLW